MPRTVRRERSVDGRDLSQYKGKDKKDPDIWKSDLEDTVNWTESINHRGTGGHNIRYIIEGQVLKKDINITNQNVKI